MNKRILFILLICVVVIPSGFAQLKTYTFEEAEQLAQKSPKPIVIFIHTSWCKYCKMMENTTFKKEEIIHELNANYYFIPLDAEAKNEIWFNQTAFYFKPTGTNTGVHELATALATIEGVISYPTLTILDSNNDIVFQKNSVIKSDLLLSVLKKL